MSGLRGLALVTCLAALALGFTVPPLAGPVNDTAGMLGSGTEQQLDAALRRLWSAGGSQIAVLTVPNLDGLAIEQASIQVTDQWKLGGAKADNGILLLIAKDERAVRIEVGQGNEGVLPDAYARRIIDGEIVPRFKSGDFDGGVLAGVRGILKYTDPKFDLGLAARPIARSRTYDDGGGFPLWIIIFFLVMGVSFFRRLFGGPRYHRRGGVWTSGGYWGGGGGRWGGGGGGGFSGGGGGFSGGGASGKW